VLRPAPQRITQLIGHEREGDTVVHGSRGKSSDSLLNTTCR
jgi:hypothetical protein